MTQVEAHDRVGGHVEEQVPEVSQRVPNQHVIVVRHTPEFHGESFWAVAHHKYLAKAVGDPLSNWVILRCGTARIDRHGAEGAVPPRNHFRVEIHLRDGSDIGHERFMKLRRNDELAVEPSTEPLDHHGLHIFRNLVCVCGVLIRAEGGLHEEARRRFRRGSAGSRLVVNRGGRRARRAHGVAGTGEGG